jgi:hypothetical protein
MVVTTVGISRLSQLDMPIDKKNRSKKNPPKSAGCGIPGKVPWHITL